MSLVLYHHGGSTCAAKVRFCLALKQIDWHGEYLDILKGDQFKPEYLKLNPKAVVPTLVHDGHVIVESTVINDYLEDVFTDISLTPNTAIERARMRLWLKALDEYIHPNFAEVNFSSCLRVVLLRGTEEEVHTFLESTPPDSITPQWHDRKKELVRKGFDTPGIDHTYGIFNKHLVNMEKALSQHEWLAGETLSLADVGLAPYIRWLSMLNMDEWWEADKPHVTQWLNRIKAMPAFQSSVTEWIPDEIQADFGNIGTETWPGVKNVLYQSGVSFPKF